MNSQEKTFVSSVDCNSEVFSPMALSGTDPLHDKTVLIFDASNENVILYLERFSLIKEHIQQLINLIMNWKIWN